MVAQYKSELLVVRRNRIRTHRRYFGAWITHSFWKLYSVMKNPYQILARIPFLTGWVLNRDAALSCELKVLVSVWSLAHQTVFTNTVWCAVRFLWSSCLIIQMMLTWLCCLSDLSSLIIGASADFFSTIIEFSFFTFKKTQDNGTHCINNKNKTKKESYNNHTHMYLCMHSQT